MPRVLVKLLQVAGLYLMATILVFACDELLGWLAVTGWIAAALPVLVAAALLGMVIGRQEWVHGLGLGTLQTALFLHIAVRIAQTNTPSGQLMFAGTERALVSGSITLLVAGAIGGYLGSLPRALRRRRAARYHQEVCK